LKDGGDLGIGEAVARERCRSETVVIHDGEREE
jgi:hypothetical protein